MQLAEFLVGEVACIAIIWSFSLIPNKYVAAIVLMLFAILLSQVFQIMLYYAR